MVIATESYILYLLYYLLLWVKNGSFSNVNSLPPIVYVLRWYSFLYINDSRILTGLRIHNTHVTLSSSGKPSKIFLTPVLHRQ